MPAIKSYKPAADSATDLPVAANDPVPCYQLALANGGMVEVLLENAVREWQAIAIPAWRRRVAAAVDSCFVHSNRTTGQSMTILLTDNTRMQALNAQFRGRGAATNVLAFASKNEGHLGDIALAYESMAAGAKFASMTESAHATHLIVHGTLHVLGFTHDDAKTAAAMEGVESHIMATLGLPDPYAIREARHGQ